MRPDAVTSLWSDQRARIGGALLVVIALLAVLAPLLATIPPDTTRDVVATRFQSPMSTDIHGVWHPLGTDRLGRDVWSRLLYGARVSLSVGVLGMALSLLIGVAVGAAAALSPGAIRFTLLGATDLALGLPRIVLLLLLAALWKPSAALVIVVLGVTGWMPVARLAYNEVRAQIARPYVDGARALGAVRTRIVWQHVLPNAMGPVLTLATLGVGNAITLEAGLSFLGLGVQPPTASWGSMIASGRDTVVNAPWVGLAPGIALVLVVTACTLIADGVQERLQ